MIDQIKISVVVPVYNLQDELCRCVRSIENQTYPNIEIILVNDGSTDKSWEIICNLAARNKRIIPVDKENGGVTSARLKGVQRATGEYIGFVDGDDEIEADMYELLLNNAVKYEADISHCGYQMIFEDGRIHFFYNTGCIEEQDRITGVRELLDGVRIEPGLCNKLFQRSLFYNLPYLDIIDRDIRINEDLLMNYYLFSLARKSVFEDVCKYHYLVRRSSASRQKMNEQKIYDPIHVKKIILQNCPEEIKVDAEKALLNTSIYTFCSLVMDERRFEKEKRDIRAIIVEHYPFVGLLTKRTRILAFLIAKMPNCFALIYPLYAKYFQKKKYE